MKRRVFVAINLPENIRKRLADYQEKWSEFPVRWTKPKNLHITLEFLGHISDEELVEVSKITKETAQRNKPFSINLSKICYGPIGKIPPRMIWAVGEKSQEFTALKNDLQKALSGSKDLSFSPENRAFYPHITLARIRQWEFRRIEPEERPDIEENIGLNFSVDSIEIMESQLKRGGAEYIVLESHQLGE